MANHKVIPETRICPVCSAQFEVGGRGRKQKRTVFCSQRCAGHARYRTGAKANTLTQAAAAYLAGFVDGEGSIMVLHYKRDDVTRIKLTLCGTKRAVLDWVLATTGVGAVTQHKTKNAKHADRYDWQCYAEAAESVLIQIAPYLILKQTQADLAIGVQSWLRVPDLKADRTWQLECVEKSKQLNLRGPQKAAA